MKNEIKEYLTYITDIVKSKKNVTEELKQELFIRIGFYQHERLVHLIVTMTFAVMTVLSFVILMLKGGMGALLLSVLFLTLVIPYIYHYYFLENSVQKLYKLYYEIEKILKDDEK